MKNTTKESRQQNGETNNNGTVTFGLLSTSLYQSQGSTFPMSDGNLNKMSENLCGTANMRLSRSRDPGSISLVSKVSIKNSMPPVKFSERIQKINK